jgi:hypothetical protein
MNHEYGRRRNVSLIGNYYHMSVMFPKKICQFSHNVVIICFIHLRQVILPIHLCCMYSADEVIYFYFLHVYIYIYEMKCFLFYFLFLFTIVYSLFMNTNEQLLHL